MNDNTKKFKDQLEKTLQENGDELSAISVDVMKHQNQVEDKLIEKVLKMYLKREVTDEDFSNCIRIYEDENNTKMNYILCYKNVKLGLLHHECKEVEGKLKFYAHFNPDITEFRTK